IGRNLGRESAIQARARKIVRRQDRKRYLSDILHTARRREFRTGVRPVHRYSGQQFHVEHLAREGRSGHAARAGTHWVWVCRRDGIKRVPRILAERQIAFAFLERHVDGRLRLPAWFYGIAIVVLPWAMAVARRAPRSSVVKPNRQRTNCTSCKSNSPLS